MTGDVVLWSEGEPLIITGPTGVGKTTLGGLLVRGRLGLEKEVIGYPVRASKKRVLYLAMDRPAQISRSLKRQFHHELRDVLDERLMVWKGPPPSDLARESKLLYELAQHADADTVVIDSLKDAAMNLSGEEVGQGVQRAMQLCVSKGVEVLVYHHQTKRGAGGVGKPNGLADVYGSAWITAGCGSVLLLWGSPGDPVVELSHLKQPCTEITPTQLLFDHTAGTVSVFRNSDLVDLLRCEGPRSAREVAVAIYSSSPTDADVERIRRKLDKLVKDGQLVKHGNPSSGGAQGGGTGVRYAVHE